VAKLTVKHHDRKDYLFLDAWEIKAAARAIDG